MKTKFKLLQRPTNLLVLIALIVGGVLPAFGTAQRRRRARRPVVRYYTVPANTVIRVRLNEELNSKTARVGDRFSTTVTVTS